MLSGLILTMPAGRYSCTAWMLTQVLTKEIAVEIAAREPLYQSNPARFSSRLLASLYLGPEVRALARHIRGEVFDRAMSRQDACRLGTGALISISSVCDLLTGIAFGEIEAVIRVITGSVMASYLLSAHL